jgi:CHAT domain-containing protein
VENRIDWEKDFYPLSRTRKEKLVLIRPLDRHLDGDELDALIVSQVPGVPVAVRLSEEAVREAEFHVESCEGCDRKLQMHRSAQNAISTRAMHREIAKGPNCPEEMDWIKVAAGLLEAAEGRERMNHAAQCGHCGPLLKAATTSLSDETTSVEENAIRKLHSTRSDWQANMARTLRDTTMPRREESVPSIWKSFFHWPRAGVAVALLAFLIAATWMGVRALGPPSPEQLLAQAYSERRTIEVRIPKAKYAPMQVERSAPGSSFEKPQPLLQAEALIAENLRRSPNDPTWLQARGRADLLDGNYDSAIDVLHQILDGNPNSPSVMVDLASAYYRRASANTDDQVDYGFAIQYLRKALAEEPSDAVAIFNLAICEEHYHAYEPAKSDWQKYLAIDPTGPWAEEARKNLSRVEGKIQKKEASLARPLLQARAFASLTQDASLSELDNRAEDYLRRAITQWLPEAFSSSRLEESGTAQSALSVLTMLARVLSANHDDVWLADVLAQSHGKDFSAGSTSLAVALIANDHGDYLRGNQESQLAARLFRAAGNSAAELRARVEELYSNHLLYDGRNCVALSDSLTIQLHQRKYAWLRAQTSLEQSNCAGLVGDQHLVHLAADRGTKDATEHRYAALQLRGLGFQADAAAAMGEVKKSVALASQGLEMFWESDVDLMKGYNLYTDLDTAADSLRLPYLQVALWQQATALIDLHPDVLQRAMAHRWFADAAYLANMPNLALLEFSKARDLFALAPQTAATLRGQLDAEIWQASLELRKGDLQLAETRLKTAQADLERHPSYAQEVSFYTTLAESKLQRRDFVGTATALRPAIFLAEWGLRTFHSQNSRQQWAERTAGTYRTLVAWKLREGDNEGALELWEWYRGAEFRSEAHSFLETVQELNSSSFPDINAASPLPAPVTVSQQMPLLTAQTVVAFAVFPKGTAVWEYDDRGVSFHWVNNEVNEIRERVNAFRELCSRKNSSLTVLTSASRGLYDLLLQPIEDRIIPGRTLIFESDDFLSDVPFDALINSAGHYLIEGHAVVISPGLYRSLILHPTAPINAQTPALIVSVSAPPMDGIDPIPAAETEAQAIASQFQFAKWLDGSEASLATIRQALPDARLFHFAGHAEAVRGRNGLLVVEQMAGSSQVSVVGPGTLTAVTTRNLQLAVLSACGTGAQLTTDSSGMESLSQVLLREGVPNVVASRWNVDSEFAALLMSEFYKHLLSGGEVSASLHSAQLRLASQPRFFHPYYWAAFSVQGS